MSYRWGKLAVVAVAMLFLWMTVSAFLPWNDGAAPTESGLISQAPSEQGSPSGETAAPQEAPTASQNAPATASELHQQHQALQQSLKSLPHRAINPNAPLAADQAGQVQLTWDVLAATKITGGFRVDYPKSLREVDGREVVLTGYMCPIDQVGEMNTFLLLEAPVGCYYCLTPSPTSIVYAELADGRRETLHYEPIKLTGRLRLNSGNPEDFLYVIADAKISPLD